MHVECAGVLNVSAQADPLVRSYAFCAKTGTRTGSVTALFVNLHRDSRRTNVDVDIAGTDGRYSHRYGCCCLLGLFFDSLRPGVEVIVTVPCSGSC